MRRILIVVGIVLGTSALASAGNWDQFIEKPGDRLPASKSKTVKADKPAPKQTAAKPAKAAPKKKQARGKKH
ncbi:MAG: hypothetical protein QM831_30925 [Kofleriaceae bacterium]